MKLKEELYNNKDINCLPSDENGNKNVFVVHETQLNNNEISGFLLKPEIVIWMKKKNKKKHYCIFCKKLGRHLLSVHKTEKEIKDANALPPTDNQRIKIMDKLRKLGDFQ